MTPSDEPWEIYMSELISRFLKDESGATAIEYGLIAALISVALITGASTLGGALSNQFGNVATKLNCKGTGTTC